MPSNNLHTERTLRFVCAYRLNHKRALPSIRSIHWYAPYLFEVNGREVDCIVWRFYQEFISKSQTVESLGNQRSYWPLGNPPMHRSNILRLSNRVGKRFCCYRRWFLFRVGRRRRVKFSNQFCLHAIYSFKKTAQAKLTCLEVRRVKPLLKYKCTFVLE